MNSAAEDSTRHIPLTLVEDYFMAHVDGVVGIAGTPPAHLVIEPSRNLLAVRFPALSSIPDLTSFENLSVDLVDDQGQPWHEFSVLVDENIAEIYGLLCGIVDRVQLADISFAEAITEALSSLNEILAKRQRLTADQELGLFGELLTLIALASEIGEVPAVDSWLGPLREEHDFALPDMDLEVKVTLDERRHHWISSVTQLMPTGYRPLYLVSIQLTAAPPGAGWSLPEIVNKVEEIADIPVDTLNGALNRSGYRNTDEDLYRERWSLRSLPAFYRVNSDFPAITQLLLDDALPNSNRILDVRYRIDLTGMSQATAILTFETFWHPKGAP